MVSVTESLICSNISNLKMKKDYLIAGHRIRIEGDETWIGAVACLDGFKPFEVEPEDEPVACFVLTDEEMPQLTESQ